MRLVLVLISSLIIALSCSEDEACRPDLKSRKISDSLTSELGRIYEQGYIKGFSVAIVNQHEIFYNKGFGYADILAKKPYETNTVQNIASVSKTLLGISLMKAQEEGKLRLDDPVNKYLPFDVINPYFPDKPITIRQLATHTSSIQDGLYYYEKSYIMNEPGSWEGDYPIPFNSPETEVSMETFLKNALAKDGEWYNNENFLNEEPGSKFNYSNVGATLAALVLEYATGIKYSEYTQRKILIPLGLRKSGWYYNSIRKENHSVLYSNNGSPFPLYHLITYPDGGLITCSSDLALYLTELIRGYSGKGKLLTKESYKEIFKEQLTAENFNERTEDFFNEEFNSGIFMGFTPEGYIGHTGGDPGTVVFMFFNPKTKMGEILMINTELDASSEEQFKAIWTTLIEYEKRFSE